MYIGRNLQSNKKCKIKVNEKRSHFFWHFVLLFCCFCFFFQKKCRHKAKTCKQSQVPFGLHFCCVCYRAVLISWFLCFLRFLFFAFCLAAFSVLLFLLLLHVLTFFFKPKIEFGIRLRFQHQQLIFSTFFHIFPPLVPRMLPFMIAPVGFLAVFGTFGASMAGVEIPPFALLPVFLLVFLSILGGKMFIVTKNQALDQEPRNSRCEIHKTWDLSWFTPKKLSESGLILSRRFTHCVPNFHQLQDPCGWSIARPGPAFASPNTPAPHGSWPLCPVVLWPSPAKQSWWRCPQEYLQGNSCRSKHRRVFRPQLFPQEWGLGNNSPSNQDHLWFKPKWFRFKRKSWLERWRLAQCESISWSPSSATPFCTAKQCLQPWTYCDRPLACRGLAKK